MICRYCGAVIERSVTDDEYVRDYGSRGYRVLVVANRVTEAWTDGATIGCDTGERLTWHEPLLILLEEVIAALQLIEADLR